jgi:hypothetical protein
VLSVSPNLKKKRKKDGILTKCFDRRGVISVYFRPMHARAPAYFDDEKRQILKEENNPFLTSTKWQKSITRPIFEKP